MEEFIRAELIYGLDSLALAVAQEEEEEVAPPRLSFCDLPISPSPITHELAQPDHLFEFFVPPPPSFINTEKEGHQYQYEKRDYLAKSQSKRREVVRAKADVNYHVQRVNFSSLTSMSAKSRRRMFMFGPIKFKPEMELSAIKQRQANRQPLPLVKPSPPPKRKSRWGLMKSTLRGRSHLTTLLARSLGCITAAQKSPAGVSCLNN